MNSRHLVDPELLPLFDIFAPNTTVARTANRDSLAALRRALTGRFERVAIEVHRIIAEDREVRTEM
jgi:hypothetical protein